MVDAINRMLLSLYGCTLPTVAAVNGHAVAGGLVTALACDYRVGAEGARRSGSPSRGSPSRTPSARWPSRPSSPLRPRGCSLVGRNDAQAEARELGVLDEVAPRPHVRARHRGRGRPRRNAARGVRPRRSGSSVPRPSRASRRSSRSRTTRSSTDGSPRRQPRRRRRSSRSSRDDGAPGDQGALRSSTRKPSPDATSRYCCRSAAAMSVK